jgi:uncharacterized protein with beta-barrel porin domain
LGIFVTLTRVDLWSRFALVLATVFTLFSLDAARPVLADCVQNGLNVVCSGASPGGFDAAGQPGLNVLVQSGAAVGTGLSLDANNVVSNLGAITVGNGANAIVASTGNQISSSGTITGGDGANGIFASDNTTVNHSGIITIGNGGGVGIFVSGPGSILNSGTITAGDLGSGIAGFTATNTGTINVGNGGVGIVGTRDGGTLINRGLINAGPSGIGIQSFNNSLTVTNSGVIVFGDCGAGIQVTGTGNTVNNSGVISDSGCGGIGIMTGAGGTVTNSGAITVGDFGGGIIGDVGTNVNNSGVIVAGPSGIGIFTGGNIVNSGTVIVGDTIGFGGGLIGQGDNLSILNSGTIIGGVGTPGMIVLGDFGTLTNSGTIVVGQDGGGMVADGNNASIANSGFIATGEDGIGIGLQGNAGIVTNSGTITVGACGVGINSSPGSGASITNSGRIIGDGCSATGVSLGNNDTLTNSGLIQAPVTGFSVLASGGNNTVFNSGTLDGPINVAGGNNLVTNAGLITVSAPLTPGAGVAHTVDGVFTQNASGTLALRVGTNPTASNFDTLAVTGVANLGGTLRAAVQPGLYGSSTTYAGVLTFASSTGSFASVESGLLFLNASAVYNSTSIDLVLTRLPFNQFPGGGSNGRAVGNALEAQYSTSLTGTAAAFYSQLLQSTAPNTLAQLSGEIASAGQNASFGAFSQLFGTVFGQINTSRTAGTGQAQAANGQRLSAQVAEACIGDACQDGPSGRRVNYWAQGFGAAGSYDANASVGSTAVSVTSGGGATGIDVYVTPGLLLGAMLGTTSAGFTMADLASTGTSQAIVFGAYSSYTAGAAYLDAALAYGIGSFTTQRFVGTGSISEQVNGAFSGSQYGGRVEGGRRFEIDRSAITPYANLTVQALQQNAYTEVSRNIATGAAGLTGLNVQAQTTTSVRSVLGAEFATTFAPTEDLVFRPRARLGWAHEFNTYRASTASFAALGPGVPFTVQGASPASDAVVVQAAVEVEVGRMFRIYGQFDGDFASTARSYAGTGGIRLVW